MTHKEFRTLIPAEEARRIINSIHVMLSTISLPVEGALGYRIAEDIISDINVPSFDRSIMDGYAVHAEDTYQACETEPLGLHVIGSISAGCSESYVLKKGESVAIATGAPIPDGADAVVMVEDTKEVDDTILVYRPVHTGENIMSRGSDILRGEQILRKNTKIGSREIGVLSATGKREIDVNTIKIGIISTGNELVTPGKSLGFGMIYDTNSYALSASIKECGATPVIYGIVTDDENAMIDAINKAVNECDMVLTSGSTSAGAGDIMYKIIDEKGKTLFHGINIKPGKPVVAGLINDVPTIGLPGNPTSALTIFNEFVAPLVRNRLDTSCNSGYRTTVSAVIGSGIKSPGRHQYLPVGLVRGKVYPADKGSGAITTLADADGFIEISAETEFLAPGTPVEVTLFGNMDEPDLMFTGGYCPGTVLLEKFTGFNFRVLNTGSTGGFSSISTGVSDIAGVNMPDDSGNYNIPVIEKMKLSDVVLIKGYIREQGLIVRQDSDISGTDDILDKRFINRNRGSGTRSLLDLNLKRFADEKGMLFNDLKKSITGYNSGAKSHHAVCNAVGEGFADVGFGIRAIAEQFGLKFIKTSDEEFDFLIRRDIIDIPEVRTLLSCLSSKQFADNLPPGISIYERTGEIINF
ncbi:MAG: molybdopterin biosynthesis protein [Methanohalobium sp.]|uniref:molybdopterin biosynthesis protein n=1 Tax=Methanohalobium sp. TaxID=2837493 RepID=UPI00397C6A2C